MLADDFVDLTDRGKACIPHCLCVRSTELAHQFVESSICDHRQVRGRVAGIDLGAPGALENTDRLTRRQQQIRGRQPGDAATDDDDVDVDVAVNFCKRWDRC